MRERTQDAKRGHVSNHPAGDFVGYARCSPAAFTLAAAGKRPIGRGSALRLRWEQGLVTRATPPAVPRRSGPRCPSTSFYGALGIKVVGLGWPSGVERGRVVFPTIPPASDVQQQGVEGLASVSTSGIHGSAVRARKACRSWRRAATTVGSKWEPASLPIVIRACSQVLARR